MRLVARDGSGLWLTYCMNVHPGGTVESTREAIRSTVLPLRARLGHAGPFGIGLRLAGAALSGAGGVGRAALALRETCAEHDLVPFTGNAFVLGDFHSLPVKEQVYAPPWSEPERVAYTTAFAVLLAGLNGGDRRRAASLSLSTAPGSWSAWGSGPLLVAACARNVAAVAANLVKVSATAGVPVRLGLEPEPGCTIQTVEEAVAFFTGPLEDALARHASGAREHVGVCYDVCHQAVVHEDPDEGLDRLLDAGIPVVKVQASCALEVPDPSSPAARDTVAAFAEPVYLHQVGARDGDGRLRVAEDLPVALGDEAWRDWSPWRVHFHVPVFRREAVAPLGTTRPFLDRVLARVAAGGVTGHLEIETYTWDVIPEAERRAGSGFDLVEALAREYESVLEVLAAHGCRPAEEDEA